MYAKLFKDFYEAATTNIKQLGYDKANTPLGEQNWMMLSIAFPEKARENFSEVEKDILQFFIKLNCCIQNKFPSDSVGLMVGKLRLHIPKNMEKVNNSDKTYNSILENKEIYKDFIQLQITGEDKHYMRVANVQSLFNELFQIDILGQTDENPKPGANWYISPNDKHPVILLAPKTFDKIILKAKKHSLFAPRKWLEDVGEALTVLIGSGLKHFEVEDATISLQEGLAIKNKGFSQQEMTMSIKKGNDFLNVKFSVTAVGASTNNEGEIFGDLLRKYINTSGKSIESIESEEIELNSEIESKEEPKVNKPEIAPNLKRAEYIAIIERNLKDKRPAPSDISGTLTTYKDSTANKEYLLRAMSDYVNSYNYIIVDRNFSNESRCGLYIDLLTQQIFDNKQGQPSDFALYKFACYVQNNL